MTNPRGPRATPDRRSRTGPVLALAAAIVVVVAIAVAAVLLVTGRHPAASPTVATSTTQQPPPEPPVPAPPSGSPTPTTPAKPPPDCANCTMLDGVTYRVGGTGTHTVRAGQYHSAGPTSPDGCAIKIVRMGAPSTEKTYGNPANVLVKDTEQFTSHGCQPWVWTPPT